MPTETTTVIANPSNDVVIESYFGVSQSSTTAASSRAGHVTPLTIRARKQIAAVSVDVIDPLPVAIHNNTKSGLRRFAHSPYLTRAHGGLR